MVHKVFTNGFGDELSIYRNYANDLYIRIENREQIEELVFCLELEDAIELHKELGKLIYELNV
jgi:hypothetical protein